MLENKSKLLSILLVIALVFSAASCNREKVNPEVSEVSSYGTSQETSVPEESDDTESKGTNDNSWADSRELSVSEASTVSNTVSDETSTGSSLVNSSDNSEQGAISTGKSSSASSEPVKDISEKKLTGKLELQIFANGSDNSRCWENAIAAFEKANPDLDVIARIGINVNTQLLTRWMSNNPPDFVSLAGANIPEETLEREGKFYDLTEWVKTANVYGSNELIKDKVKNGMFQYNYNKLSKMPISMGSYGLWYDNNYFSKNNLTVPKNYEEMIQFAAEADSLGKSVLCYPGVYSGYLVWGLVMPAIAAYGSEYFNQVSGAVSPEVFQDERMKSVLTRLKQFADSGYIMSGTVALNHIESQMEWLNRNALFIPNGLWLETEMANDIPIDFEMRYTALSLATKNQKQTVVPYVSNVAVAEKGKNIDNALAFVRYLYRDEVIKDFAEVLGSLSTCDVDASNYKYSEVAKAAIEYILSDDVQIVYKTATWGTVDAEMNNVVNALVLGQITVQQACDRLSEATRVKIAENG